MGIYHIRTEKTARVYTLGKIQEQTETIWLVLHGYGMLSEYLIQKFDFLDLNKNYIIAPEALSRFYQTGFHGRIGASWMTSSDRDYEISNYISYLNKVFEQLVISHIEGKKIIGLGFSQGVSTLFRWLNQRQETFNKAIAWSGKIPDDVLQNYQIKAQSTSIVYGTEDPFLSKEDIQSYLKRLKETQLNFTSTAFQGGHTLIKDILVEISNM